MNQHWCCIDACRHHCFPCTVTGISTCCHNKHVSKCTYAAVCGVKWKKDRKQICASNIRKKMHSSLAHPSGPQKYVRSKIDLFVFKWPQSKQAQGRCRAQLCWDTETDYCLQHGCYCCCICFPLIHLFLLRKYHLLWSIWENYLGKTFFSAFPSDEAMVKMWQDMAYLSAI